MIAAICTPDCNLHVGVRRGVSEPGKPVGAAAISLLASFMMGGVQILGLR